MVPVPALVALRLQETWLCQCAGVGLRGRVWIDLPGRARRGQTGDVLITHRGLSGPGVLDLSSEVSELLGRGARKSVPLRLEACAGVGKAQWKERLEGWRRHEGRRRLEMLLAQHLPARLAELFCRQAGCLGRAAAQTSAAQGQALAGMLAALSLTASGTEGFASAMVTRGGVSLRQVDPRTLQSRLLAGLFFAGEVLDLDGPCGGYNLQWAFSSGRLAGLSAARTRDAGS
jgi:predicted Rossmann fold flavoprotein